MFALSANGHGNPFVFRIICALIFAAWILASPFLGIAFMESLHWDRSFGHPPVPFWIFCGGYLAAGLLLFMALRQRGDSAFVEVGAEASVDPAGTARGTGQQRRPIALRVVCTLLFGCWILAIPLLGVAFMLSLDWDHSFGHPPVPFWIFCAIFVVAGLPLHRGARPPKCATR